MEPAGDEPGLPEVEGALVRGGTVRACTDMFGIEVRGVSVAAAAVPSPAELGRGGGVSLDWIWLGAVAGDARSTGRVMSTPRRPEQIPATRHGRAGCATSSSPGVRPGSPRWRCR